MSPPLELLQHILRFRLDAIGFAALVLGAGFICCAFTRRRQPAQVNARITWGLVATIVVASTLAAEWAANHRRESLASALAAFGPIYANELRKLGHAEVSDAGPAAHAQTRIIRAAAGEWLRLNPSIRDLFTVRPAGGSVAVAVDATGRRAAGSPYPGHPALQRAFAGDSAVDPAVYRDGPDAWIRTFTPLRDNSGRVESVLVVGQPAAGWLESIAAWRVLALGGTAAFAIVLLSGVTLVTLMRAEIRGRIQTEGLLQRAKTAADDASRAKSDFLAVMSHEIRTPLNAVMGFANLLSETKLDDSQRDYLATINSEGQRLTALINNILDLTKIEEGRLVLERLPFSPVETANEVLRLLSPRALEKKIELRFEAQVIGPLLVAGDPLRFRQVLLNLIDNAIKFTPRGSVTLFLVWQPPAAAGGQGGLSVQVRDTGIGMPNDKLKELFQMFVQADSSTTRRYGGTGLGLAICQRLVGLMGGEIVARNAPDGGAEFSFSLRLTPVAAPEEAPPAKPETRPIAGHRPSVLVVDDMDTNRFLLEIFLARSGFDPELAASGEEAIRLASAKNYDAILMDLQMPDIDGFAATRRIRDLETAGRRTPIIALTASIAKGTREKCLAAGMDDYLTKPLDLRKFKALLEGFIAEAAARRGPFAPSPAPAIEQQPADRLA